MTDQPDDLSTLDTAALMTALYKLVQEAIDGLAAGLHGDTTATLVMPRKVAQLVSSLADEPAIKALMYVQRTAVTRHNLDDAALLRTFVQETVGKDALDLDTTFAILRFAGFVETIASTESESGPLGVLGDRIVDMLQQHYTDKLVPTSSPCVHTPPAPFWNAPSPSIAAVPSVEIDSGLRMQVLTQLVDLGLIDSETGRLDPNLWKLVLELIEAQRAVDG